LPFESDFEEACVARKKRGRKTSGLRL